MIKSDWNIFKAKFENYRENFEWLCYILFCIEYKKENGIFRYKNQAGIETDPIIENQNVIGWQAKFYETTLSSNKREMLDTLDTCSEKYPKLNHLIFYTNEEWGQSPSKGKSDTAAKIEIEEKAKELGIQLEWRTASYFDSPEVAINNQEIAKYFFSFEKSAFDLINDLEFHSQSILEEIASSIIFDEQIIRFDRNKVKEKLIDEVNNQKMIVLSGEGGSGKTAIIKEIYEETNDEQPFYIFKASEFEIPNINSLFKDYDMYGFIKAHEIESEKLVVIDSAEKLLDIKNPEPFKEFISLMKKNGWTIIFTIRSSYVNDLIIHFIEQHNVNPVQINIPTSTKQELLSLSEMHNFNLPRDEKVLGLIRNPFYLNEYLKLHDSDNGLNLKKFKTRLWDKVVKKGKPNREKVFIEIAKKRADSGQFFVKIDHVDESITGLLDDGILGSEADKYFITHDIYEEWGLEKIISNEFSNKKSYPEFFVNIGESLSMRRSFRKWMTIEIDSENSLGNFIDDAIYDEKIPQFWKDEILVSILLSDSSDLFFKSMARLLSKNDFSLFKRVLFLIRIACKEIDFKTAERFKEKVNSVSAQYLFTVPMGHGWKSVISFIDKHQKEFELEDLKLIVPVLKDWTTKNKRGDITRKCASFALRNYQELFISMKSDYKLSDIKAELTQIILDGSVEIRKEISDILADIVKNKWSKSETPYYDLIYKIVNTPMDSIPVYAAVPKKILAFLKIVWSDDSKQVSDEFLMPFDSEKNEFGINSTTQHNYFPASAYQTPIYWLLAYDFSDTMHFIIDFINTSSEFYFEIANTNDKKKIEVLIRGKSYTQISSSTLWNAFRGNSNVPYVFSSILMALEKYLLDTYEETNLEIFENNLIEILKMSKSVAISAVVTSVVLAHPVELFNVAEILFRTKEFFLLDHERKIFDLTNHEFPMEFVTSQIHDEYRKANNALEHRKNDLEFQALTYQFFRAENVSEEEADRRQKKIFGIFDTFYEELSVRPGIDDRDWRMSLSRMDRRKMSPEVEQHHQGFLINFNPELEPDLKEYSEAYNLYLEKTNAQVNKYLLLSNWAKNLIDGKYSDREASEFDNNPNLAVQRIQEFLEDIEEMDEGRHLIFKSMPANVSVALMENYINELTQENREFCARVILEHSLIPFNDNRTAYFGEGVEVAIRALPIIIKDVQKFSNEAKMVLIVGLLYSKAIRNDVRMSGLAADAIRESLWRLDKETADSILTSYIILKPKLNTEKMPSQNNLYDFESVQINQFEQLKSFVESQEEFIDKVIVNQIDIPNKFVLESDNLEYLSTIYRMINSKFLSQPIYELIRDVQEVFLDKLYNNGEYSTTNFYFDKLYFKQRYPETVLMLPEEKLSDLLDPFLKRISSNEITADLLQNFIYVEDRLQSGDTFWNVWEMFYEKILNLNNQYKNDYFLPKVVHSYLFAEIFWNKDASSWSGFGMRGKGFFKNVIREFDLTPAILFSFLRILNSVGQVYLLEGVYWISSILKSDCLISENLEKGTIYLLEEFCKKFIFKYRDKLKKTPEIKSSILVLLNFLIENGSVTGYLLRENIL